MVLVKAGVEARTEAGEAMPWATMSPLGPGPCRIISSLIFFVRNFEQSVTLFYNTLLNVSNLYLIRLI